jgi:hypothetical protein
VAGNHFAFGAFNTYMGSECPPYKESNIMSVTRSTFFKWAAAGVVAAGALFAATSASARGDVSWSIGVGVPGVSVGVGAPAYYPAPVYAPPAPVYYAPPPPVYYRPPPVYYRPAPVYYAPPAYYGPRYYGRGYYRGHGHWR